MVPAPLSFLQIKSKKAVINIKNEDSRCFMYAILGKFVENERSNKQKVWMYNKLLQDPNFINSPIFPNFSGITYLTLLNEIKIFEKNNYCSINLYTLDEDEEVYPLRVSENIILEKHWDSLFTERVEAVSLLLY